MCENQEKWKILRQKVFERRIRESFELFRRNDIEPILIKGWAASLNYPNPAERIYTDIDLAVSEKDYEKGLTLITNITKNGLYVDLHKELRYLDTLEWRELFGRSRLIKLEVSLIRVLSSEDHLRLLSVHWLNDGGAYKERLRDIYYAAANRPEDFDWERCLGAAGEKRRKWVICALKLAEKHLKLDLDDTPVAAIEYEIPQWVTRTIEKEWSRDIKLEPLRFSKGHIKEFGEQMKIRFSPNPILATVMMDGELGDTPERFIRAGNFFRRFKLRLTKSLETAFSNIFKHFK